MPLSELPLWFALPAALLLTLSGLLTLIESDMQPDLAHAVATARASLAGAP